MEPPRIPSVCENWWPISTITNTTAPLPCYTCANWLPDIEEIGNIKSCQNLWPKPSYIINTPRTELRPPS
jgi:hypothetical protein